MIATTLRQLLRVAAPLIALMLPLGTAWAEDASAWDGDARTATRLIAGSPRAADGTLRAGVEIRLASGWKTYWRYPGDSGVPPRFDFAGSQNVKFVAIDYPAPQRFTDEGGITIGYKDGVIFPLRVVPQDPTKPVVLRLKLDYAVCEKLCVPAQSQAELTLDGRRSALDGELEAAEALVPKHAAFGATAPLAVRTVRREPGGAHPRIVVDVAAPESGPIDLFAEGPTPDWALPVPESAPGAPAGLHRFVFVLDGVPPGATADGAVITLTLVSGTSAIEVSTHLD
jgi:DsbC/DsbD-like thiol-disulfide interchange protein